MTSKRDLFRSNVDPGSSEHFYDDEDVMEDEMDHLNISVSAKSLPPFSTLEKPTNPIHATSCTNIVKKVIAKILQKYNRVKVAQA